MIKINKKIFFLALIISVFVMNFLALDCLAFYQDQTVDYFNTTSSLGHGGTFTNDNNELANAFQNPAMLSRTKFALSIPSFGGELSKDTIDAISTLSKLKDTSKLSGILSPYFGKMLHGTVNLTTGFAFNGLMFAYMLNAYANADIRNKAMPDLNAALFIDNGLAVGGGFSLLAQKLHLGASVGFLNRYGMGAEFSLKNLANSETKDLTFRGSAIDVNLGSQFIFNPKSKYQASLGLSIDHMGDTTFDNAKGDFEIVRKIKQSINFGYAQLFTEKIKLTADIHHLLNKGQLIKKIKMGLQFRPISLVAFSAGLYQGYPTLGMDMNLKVVSLSFAHYTSEAGVYPGNRPDKRYAMNLNLGWSDPAN